MCSNDVLKERIDNVISKIDDVADALNKHVEDQATLIERLDNRYPTRRELTAIKRAGGILLTVSTAIASFLGMAK